MDGGGEMCYRVQRAEEIRAAQTVMEAACCVDQIIADTKSACKKAINDQLDLNFNKTIAGAKVRK